MKVEVFGKQGCSICGSARRKLAHLLNKWGCKGKVDIVFIDMDTVDGLAEGAFNDVSDIPTTIVSDNGNALGRWEGQVPRSEEIKRALGACR